MSQHIKSPAFQVYVNDFLGSTRVGLMTVGEIGAYWLLLLRDWQDGGITTDRDELAVLARMTPEAFEVAWKRVGPCFIERRGKLYNPRLQKERDKQKKWRAKSRTGGINSGAARRKAAKGGCEMVEPPHKPNTNTPLPLPLPSTKTTSRGERAATWVSPYADAWLAQYGGKMAVKQAVTALAPLHKEHGLDETLRRWRIYLATTDGQYASAPRFASTWSTWASPPTASGRGWHKPDPAPTNVHTSAPSPKSDLCPFCVAAPGLTPKGRPDVLHESTCHLYDPSVRHAA